MLNKKRILSIILARENSKGLPGKNVKQLNGKPLLAWPITASNGSKYIDSTILSTDSNNYANIGKTYGASTPFIRPSSLANDTSPSSEAVIHAIEFLQKTNDIYDYIILLEPTSPLTQSSDIDLAIESLLNQNKYTSLVSVSEVVSTHPSYCYVIEHDMQIKPYQSKMESLRRQEIQELYHCDGSLYISKVNDFLLNKTFYHENTMAYIMPKWKALEVDDDLDFFLIEQIMNNYKKSEYEKK